MSNNHLPDRVGRRRSDTLHLMLGAPLLCALLSTLAWVEWAVQGFAPELSPRHWLDYHGALFLGMSFAGGFITLLAAGLLLLLGNIAMALGETTTRAFRRFRGF